MDINMSDNQRRSAKALKESPNPIRLASTKAKFFESVQYDHCRENSMW